MSCNTRSGPQAYLKTVKALTGHRVTADQWHMLKELAAEDMRYQEYQRLQAEAVATGVKTPYDTAYDHAFGEAVQEHARKETGRTQADLNTRVQAAVALERRLVRETGRDDADAAEHFTEMQIAAAEGRSTKGTIAIVNYMAEHGVKNSLKRADQRLREQQAHMNVKRRLERDADAEATQNPTLAEGMRKAASMITKHGDGEVFRWRLSGDMEREYPGLTAKYDLLSRGDGPQRKFSMYTYEGNVAAQEACTDVEQAMRDAAAKGETWDRTYVESMIRVHMDRVESTHPEVYDTEPRFEFYSRTTRLGRELGWLDEYADSPYGD